eukprot:gene4854-9677_t
MVFQILQKLDGEPLLTDLFPEGTFLYMDPPPLFVFQSVVSIGKRSFQEACGDVLEVGRPSPVSADLDGNKLSCTCKSAAVKRIKTVKTLLRVLPVSKDRFDEILFDWVFDVEVFVQDVRATVSNEVVSYYAYIEAMPVYHPVSRRQSTILGAFCYRHGRMLAHGVRGLELFWTIMWNPKFQGCFEGLASALVDSRSHFNSFHNVFVRCRLEEMFVNFNSDIHSRARSKYQRDEKKLGMRLRNVDECLVLLHVAEFISGKVDHTTSVNKWEPVLHTCFYSQEWPPLFAPHSASTSYLTPSRASSSSILSLGNGSVPLSFTAVATCQWHLASLFGLAVKGQPLVTRLKSYTRDEAVVLSSALPKYFKTPLQSLRLKTLGLDFEEGLTPDGRDVGDGGEDGTMRIVEEAVVVPEALSCPTELAGGRSGGPCAPPILLGPWVGSADGTEPAAVTEQGGWCAARLRQGSRTPVDFFNDSRLSLGIPSMIWSGAGDKDCSPGFLCCPTDSRGRSHTRIAPSALPDAGLGAFARELLEPDVWIGSYSGTSWGRGLDTRYRVEYGDVMTTRLFPTLSSSYSVGGVRQVVQSAFDHNDLAKSLRDAAAWAHVYKLERMWIEADTQLLSQLGSMVAVAAFRCRLTCSSRLNPDRVHQWVSLDNPDYDSILRLATTGIPLLADPDFKSNMGAPGPRYYRCCPRCKK